MVWSDSSEGRCCEETSTVVSTTGNSTPLPGDNPIEYHEDDVLERAGLAIAFARRVLELDASHGTTIGVFGPWGSGKTSFINLARKTFEQEGALILDFNPWLFSGAEQLVERFFTELSASMGMATELEEIGDAFRKYGAALNAVAGVASALLAVPQIGAIVTQIMKAAANASQPASVHDLRKSVEDALQKHGKRIVVVLDDHDAERAVSRMADRDSLNKFLYSLEPTQWQDVISNLCGLADEFRTEYVEPGVVVLLNLWPDMPERPSRSSIPGDNAMRTIRRAIYRLLHSLEGAATVEAAVRRILPQVTSLSSKVVLVRLVGHRKNSDHELVSETAAYEFENMLRHEIRTASADELAKERDPSLVLVFAKHCGSPTDEPFEIDASPQLTISLLQSVRGETQTGSPGSRGVSRSAVLNWDCLIDLYGDKEVLESRINDLKSRFDTLKSWLEARRISLDEAEQLLELAERYLSGWRPEAT